MQDSQPSGPTEPESAPSPDRADEPDPAVLLIVPPFASIWYPSLAAHVLQACVREVGFGMDVLYANLLLASTLGEDAYEKIAAESISLGAERYFARSAFNLPPLGHGAEEAFAASRVYGKEQAQRGKGLYPDVKAATMGHTNALDPQEFLRLERVSDAWVQAVAEKIVERPYKIVGASTTFQQTTASIALLNRVKRLRPDIVTVLGGANCEGEMAEGLLELGTAIDFIFSGESERTFPDFVRRVLAGSRPESRIIVGSPLQDMDSLPFISSKEFFDQRESYLPDSVAAETMQISFETSRGCWWGQKQHCTFCGLNGEGMAFRKKSPDRAFRELRALLEESPTRNVTMTDNIMPHDYFRSFVPRVQEELPGVRIFYEQKANLSLEDVLSLADAGIDIIQPGIEALSTGLLKLMRKGVSGRQNLMLLRYGRVAKVRLVWNLICAFPGDELDFYLDTLELVPLIVHLQPPNGVFHLSIERFSPYFVQSEHHGISNVTPLPVYKDFLPAHADTAKIAYHFVGEYQSETHTGIEKVRELSAAVQGWLRAWEEPESARPELAIEERRGEFILRDTRGMEGAPRERRLSREEAAFLLSASPRRDDADQDRAIFDKLAVCRDGWFVPLVTAERSLFVQLSGEASKAVSPRDGQLIRLRTSAAASG
jgi:ribosomal peptide maturation radical SAM protein 1